MINIIGLGYIGLPTALMFSKAGHNVIGTDINKSLVDTLNQGNLTFNETGLDELFQAALLNDIKFTTEYVKSDIYIVAVPTPYLLSNKKIDPQFVIQAVNKIIEVSNKGAVIVIESTISPGSIDKFVRPIIEDMGLVIGVDIHIAHAPERIIPGNMIYELENNSRTIGVDDMVIGEQLKEIYSTFCKGEIILTK